MAICNEESYRLLNYDDNTPLKAISLLEVSIDHVKPIDQTLQVLYGSCPQLRKITDLFNKDGLKSDDSTLEAIRNSIRGIKELDEKALYIEIKRILDDTEYWLLEKSKNSSKGNKLIV